MSFVRACDQVGVSVAGIDGVATTVPGDPGGPVSP
jgi:hypothetical protein